jgi:hypothetical protein
MSSLFAHHTEAFFQVEVMGRSFPDGMTEHVLTYAATAFVLGLLTYGAVAAVRDLVRWRRARRPAAVEHAR